MEKLKIKSLLNIEETIAKDIFSGKTYPWEVLSFIGDFILSIGEKLDKNKYDQINDGVWVAKSAKICSSAYIEGPAIIDEDAEVRHCAFIRGKVIVGKGAVVGNSVEIKNSIIFNKAQIPHYNYIGDSVIGYKAHFGAQSLTSNVKSDKTLTTVKIEDMKIETALKKFGAIVGDNVEIGCSTVLNPATVVGRNTNIYPLSSVRGYIDENVIFKDKNNIVKKI